jgi:hypothetical protein
MKIKTNTLSGHLKSGQWRSPQIRPIEMRMGHDLLYPD